MSVYFYIFYQYVFDIGWQLLDKWAPAKLTKVMAWIFSLSRTSSSFRHPWKIFRSKSRLSIIKLWLVCRISMWAWDIPASWPPSMSERRGKSHRYVLWGNLKYPKNIQSHFRWEERSLNDKISAFSIAYIVYLSRFLLEVRQRPSRRTYNFYYMYVEYTKYLGLFTLTSRFTWLILC